MTQRNVWLGTTGPFLYDDSIYLIDENENPTTYEQEGISTDGQISALTAPSKSEHVVRKYELDNIAVTLGLRTMAYQDANNLNISGGSISVVRLGVSAPAPASDGLIYLNG